MQKNKAIEFNGRHLRYGFQVYIYEIIYAESRYYYAGMTGDNHYPVARSAMHRFSGHISTGSRSTQSQLLKGIYEKILYKRKLIENIELRLKEMLHDKEIDSLNFKLFTFNIEGYVYYKNAKYPNKKSKEYLSYKNCQNDVAKLESCLIELLEEKVGQDYLLNKSKKSRRITRSDSENYNSKVREILKVVGIKTSR